MPAYPTPPVFPCPSCGRPTFARSPYPHYADGTYTLRDHYSDGRRGWCTSVVIEGDHR